MTDPKANLPEGKKTVLGLYVTAKGAYEQWKAAPDKVKIIDVRTPEEYLFVGSPEMAWKIPVIAQSYEWDATKEKYPMKLLPDFVARVQTMAKPEDTLMVTCRSGGRSSDWVVGRKLNCQRRPPARRAPVGNHERQPLTRKPMAKL